MPSVEISTGAVEPIVVDYQVDGVPETGATLTYQVSRVVSGTVEILDRADETFRASPATPTASLPPSTVASTYAATLDTSAIMNPSTSGTYRISIFDGAEQIDGWDLRVGLVDTVEAIPSAALNASTLLGSTITGYTDTTKAGGVLHMQRAFGLHRIEEDEGNPGSLKVYKLDGVTVWFTFQLRDQDGLAVVGTANEPARRSAAVIT